MKTIKINSALVQKALKPPRRPNPDSVSDDRIPALKHQFARIARSINPAFIFRSDMARQYSDIFRWCLGLSTPLDPGKGLWLYGSCGTGKSSLIPLIGAFAAIHRPRLRTLDPPPYNRLLPFAPRIFNAMRDICPRWQKDGYKALRIFEHEIYIAIDDLGEENIPTLHYSQPLNVLQYVLQARYHIFHRGAVTLVTSNLSIGDPENLARYGYDPADAATNQIAEIYGDRIWDRCREMFNFIPMIGRSWRDPSFSP